MKSSLIVAVLVVFISASYSVAYDCPDEYKGWVTGGNYVGYIERRGTSGAGCPCFEYVLGRAVYSSGTWEKVYQYGCSSWYYNYGIISCSYGCWNVDPNSLDAEQAFAYSLFESNMLLDYLNNEWPDGSGDPNFNDIFLNLFSIKDPNTLPYPPPFTNDAVTTDRIEPVFMSNGEYKLSATDMVLRGRALNVSIKRTYGSKRDYNSRFGYGWDMNYNMKVRRLAMEPPEPNIVVLLNGGGYRYEYIQKESDPNVYERETDFSDYLQYDSAYDDFVLVTKSGARYIFDPNGNLARIKDKNGNALVFNYDSGGLSSVNGQSEYFCPEAADFNEPPYKYGLVVQEYKLISITDDLGRSINFTYNTDGLLDTITDYVNRKWTYTYEPNNNNLISVEDPHGNVVEYSYDYNHKLTGIIDANGQKYIVNYYDSSDKLYQQDYGYGTHTVDYNEPNKTTTRIDREGYKTIMVYSDSGQVLSETFYTADGNDEPNSFTTQYLYNPNNLELLRTILPAGNCIDYAHNDLANVTGIYRKTGTSEPNTASDPDVIATTYTYDSTHINDINSVTDPRGNTTEFEYDSNGNVTKITYPEVAVYGDSNDNPTVEYTYNSYGQVETITAPDGIVTRYEYYTSGDSNGMLYKITVDYGTGNELNIETTFTYDKVGNVVTSTDPNGNTTQFDYNELDQLMETASPLNCVTHFSYNKNRKLSKIERDITDEPNQITTYAYDILDHLKSLTDPCGYITTYGYNKNEDPNIVIDAEDHNRVSVYDERGLLKEVVDAKGNSTVYHYTLNGDINDITDANGNVTRYEYDGFDRLIKIVYPDESNEVFGYDKNSNLTSKTNRKGQTISYEYDALNRMTVKTLPGDIDIDFAYDIASRIKEVDDSRSAGDGGGVTTYSYNRVGRVEEVNDIENRLVSYKYDDRGLRTKLTYPDDSNVTYEYDKMSRLKVVKYNGSIVAEYDYDELSRRTLLTLGNDANAVYKYDIANRLTDVNNNFADAGSATLTFHYTHDDVDNRLTMTVDNSDVHQYGYDELYQLTDANYPDSTEVDYNYDALGNRTSVVNGGTTNYSSNKLNQYDYVDSADYEYDQNGNLTGIDVDDNGTNEYEYIYDCENRLTEAKESDQTVAEYAYDYQGRRIAKTVDSNTTKYCYDGDQVIAEYENGALVRKFIYGPGIDEPICMIDVAHSNDVYYYHFDGLGSVVALSDVNSEIVETYSYDVFGEPNTTSTIGNPYYFTGRRYDTETDLYYYRARYYDHVTGRFLQVDPLGYEDSMNLYSYVGNNPVSWLDPLGLKKDDIESKKRRINQLRNYINSAETAVIANIETLEMLHGKVQRLHDYYWWLLVGNTTVSAVSVVHTVYLFSQSASYANTATVITTKFPVRGIGDASTWDASIRLCDMSAKTFISAKKSAFIDAGFTAVSFLSVFRIDMARRKAISKYEPLIQQTLTNIQSLSNSVSIAREELRRLEYSE